MTVDNDGIFFMEFEYMVRYGDVSTVAVDLDFAQTQTWEISQTTQREVIKIENPEDQTMFITLETVNQRNLPEGCAPKRHINFQLFDPNGQELQFGKSFNYVGGGLFHANLGDLAMQHNWIKGEYNMIVFNWAEGVNPDYIIQAYSMQNTTHVKLNGQPGTNQNIKEEWKIADQKYIEDFKPEIPTPGNDDIDPGKVIEDVIENETNSTDGELVNNTSDTTDDQPTHDPSKDETTNADGCFGEWVNTDAFASGERCLGTVESHADCVAKAKLYCTGFDLANVH